jgi:hypothetical protein
MKIYYVETYEDLVGCVNRFKLEKMYPWYEIHLCDISEFKGRLLGSEYL